MAGKMARWTVGLLFFVLSEGALSIPFTATDDSGQRGDSVSIALIDSNTANLLAATIEILFESQYLQFLSATQGDVTSSFSLFVDDSEADQGKVVASLAGFAPVPDGTSGSLLLTSFEILGNAPVGNVPVTFQCLSGTCGSDYNIPATTGQVQVQAPPFVGVPEPVTWWLLLPGLLLVRGVRKAT